MAHNLLEYLLVELHQCHQIMLLLQWEQILMALLQWDQIIMSLLQLDQLTEHLQWDKITELLQFMVNLIMVNMVNLTITNHHQITILITLLHLNQPILIHLLLLLRPQG